MTNSGDQGGGRWRGAGRLFRRRSITLRALAIACLLPVPVALAAPPALVDSLESASRALFSPARDVELPLGYLASDFEPVRDVDHSRAGSWTGTAAGVVTVPSSKARVRAASLAGDYDMPAAALYAYREAAATLERTDPACRIDWALLAGIGRVESDHGRYAGTTVHDDGTTSPHILGLPLDGSPGVAAISDSDGGQIDGDTVWDRAVGPMQFIPTTWSMMAADGDGDGRSNPHDLDDAALAAGVYLCAGDGDLSTRSGAEAAVFRYNHSDEYVALVLSLAKAYRSGVVALPSTPVSGSGSAPTLEEVPDTSVNGEKSAEPADTSDEQRSPSGTDRKQPTDREESPAPRQQQGPDEDSEQPPAAEGDRKAPSGGGNGTDGGDTDDSSPDDSPDDSDEDNQPPADDGTNDEDKQPPADDGTNEPEPQDLKSSVTSCDDSQICITDDGRELTLVFDEVGDRTAAENYDNDDSRESIEDELRGLAGTDRIVTLEVRVEGGTANVLDVRAVDPEVRSAEHDGTLSSAGTGEDRAWALTTTTDEQSEQTWTLHVDDPETDAAHNFDGKGEEAASIGEELAGLVGQQEVEWTLETTTQSGESTTSLIAIDEMDLTTPLTVTSERPAS